MGSNGFRRSAKLDLPGIESRHSRNPVGLRDESSDRPNRTDEPISSGRERWRTWPRVVWMAMGTRRKRERRDPRIAPAMGSTPLGMALRSAEFDPGQAQARWNCRASVPEAVRDEPCGRPSTAVVCHELGEATPDHPGSQCGKARRLGRRATLVTATRSPRKRRCELV